MPMMRGIKFACEPCIRGHRSSKCNHSDRVLVQVRKPGRPLSSCPHTLSSSSPGTFVHSLPGGAPGENGAGNSSEAGRVSCSCDVASIAIPLVASCACGVPKPHEPPQRPPLLSIVPPTPSQSSTINDSSPTMITSPMSPISPTIVSANSVINGSANKVTKSQRSKKPVRRESVIVGEAALELLLEQERDRSETESLEIENTENNCGEVTGIQNGNFSVNGNGIQEFTPSFSATVENGDGANGFHLSQQFSHVQNGSVVPGNSKQLPVINGGLVAKPAIVVGMNGILSQDIWDSSTGGSSPWQLPQTTAKKTDCGGCSGKSPQPPQSQLQQQYMHHTPTLTNQQQSPGCCSNSNKTITIQQQQQSLPVPQPPFSTPQFFPAPQYPPSYVPTPNFPQVPNAWMYSMINHPITHQEFAWLQQQRAAGLFGPQPAPQASGHVSSPPSMANNSTMINNPLGNSWGYSCHCGPNCNCLGCATHPFNRRTVEHVREMQSFMAGDNGASSPHSHSHHNHSRALVQQLSQPQPQQNGFEATGISPPPAAPTGSSPEGFSCNDNGTPASASSAPCCGKKGSQEEQQISPPPEPEDEVGTDETPGGTEPGGELSPSGFIYFDYPLGMCAQMETGCKCGEGCTCVGCVTHGGHDGVELEGNGEEHAGWGAWGIEGGS